MSQQYRLPAAAPSTFSKILDYPTKEYNATEYAAVWWAGFAILPRRSRPIPLSHHPAAATAAGPTSKLSLTSAAASARHRCLSLIATHSCSACVSQHAQRSSIDNAPPRVIPGDFYVPGLGYLPSNHPYWARKEINATELEKKNFRFWSVIVVAVTLAWIHGKSKKARKL